MILYGLFDVTKKFIFFYDVSFKTLFLNENLPHIFSCIERGAFVMHASEYYIFWI